MTAVAIAVESAQRHYVALYRANAMVYHQRPEQPYNRMERDADIQCVRERESEWERKGERERDVKRKGGRVRERVGVDGKAKGPSRKLQPRCMQFHSHH